MSHPDLQLICEYYGLAHDLDVEDSLEALAQMFLDGNDGPSEATHWTHNFYKKPPATADGLLKETLHQIP
jgi:hypothetical protein